MLIYSIKHQSLCSQKKKIYRSITILIEIKHTPLNYINTNIGQKFIDSLGPSIFNSMLFNIKIGIRSNRTNNVNE